MAGSTRQAKKDILNRVFKDILDLDDDSNLHKACEQDNVGSIDALLIFTPVEIADLTYLVSNVKTKISKGHAGCVFALQALSLKRVADGDRIHNDWNNVTQKEYDDFRVSPEYISARAGLPNPA